MSQQDDTFNPARPQDHGADNGETGIGSRLTGGLRRAKDSAGQGLQLSGQTMSATAGAARQGLQRSGETISDATDTARQGLQRSGEAISDATDTARQGLQRSGEAISDATDTARQGLQRSGEVFTGADIRKFDDFTEAVTRVCVGLHQDNVQLRERIIHLEHALEESNRAQADLMERVAVLEGKTTDKPSSQGQLP